MSENAVDRARRLVLRASHRALSLDEFRRAVDAALRPLVGWDAAAWSTTDPATLLFTSCLLLGMDEDPAAERRLFEHEFRIADHNQFRDLAQAASPVATLHTATGGDLAGSARWRDLLARRGVTDELRAAFVDRADCWGSLVAYRFGGAPFTAAQVAVVAAVAPLIGDGLRRCMLRDAAGAAPTLSDAPGVIMTDDEGRVVQTTAQAERWLDQIASPGTTPSVVRSVAAAAAAAAQGGGRAPAQARLPRTGGGWLVLHGSLSKGDAGDRVAIVIEPARQTHLADVMVRAYGLTPREREITELVLRGLSTARIAAELGITPYTIQDHLKAILAKADVSSRRDLVAELFGRHYAPAAQAGALPSPYGWYLPGPTPAPGRAPDSAD